MLFCKLGLAPNFNNSLSAFKLLAMIALYIGVQPFSFCLSISVISEQ